MSKKIFEVRGTTEIEVIKRVMAENEEEAKVLAEKHFQGIHTEWNGNSVFVRGEGEEVNTSNYSDIEWFSVEETMNNDYDSETEPEEEEDEWEDDWE